MKEFYVNAIVEEDELKCWVQGKSFSVTPAYLAEILHINKPMLRKPPVYDDLYLEEDLLREHLVKTWNSHQMETQSMFPLYLLN